MILFFIYSFAGIYMLLISTGVIHKKFWDQKDPFTRSNIRMALVLFGFGMLILGLYYGYVYGIVSPAIEKNRTETRAQQLKKPLPGP